MGNRELRVTSPSSQHETVTATSAANSAAVSWWVDTGPDSGPSMTLGPPLLPASRWNSTLEHRSPQCTPQAKVNKAELRAAFLGAEVHSNSPGPCTLSNIQEASLLFS